ncbi:MAG: hypothetical protein AAF493_01935 [Pseudomonadota bacterium]
MSLIARYLEEHGVPTVMMATARDIVETCGVPRLLFVDFPLGNPCGEPYDGPQQHRLLEQALTLLETATGPRTTVDAGVRWSNGDDWKALVFTAAQPYLSGADHDEWIARKQAYRDLRK